LNQKRRLKRLRKAAKEFVCCHQGDIVRGAYAKPLDWYCFDVVRVFDIKKEKKLTRD
jgi:hypothetical protein